MSRSWRNRFASAFFKGAQGRDAVQQRARRPKAGMFVRLANGKRVEIPAAEYVQSLEGGRVLFLDENREVLREFSWIDVVAHGRMK